VDWTFGLRKKKDPKPEVREAGRMYQFAIDSFGGGYAASFYEGWLQIPAVDRGVSLYTDTIGNCEWNAFRERGGKREKLSRPLVLEQPNPEEPAANTYGAWVLDYIMHGNAFGVIASRDAQGVPTSITPVPAERVSVRRVVKAGEWLPVGAIEYRVGAQVYSAYQVFHVKGQCRPGDIRGMGIIEKHFATQSLAAEQQRQAGNVAQSSVPTLVYKSANPDLNQTSADAIKSKLMSTQRDRSPAVIPAADEIKPLAWNPTEMQMIEARQFGLTEWALVLGLPPYFLGASKSSDTYSNIQQEALNFAKFSLNGIKQRFEQTLSALLPRGTKVEADLSNLLKTDTKTELETYQIGLNAGIYTIDEVRERMGLDPLPKEAKTNGNSTQAGNQDPNSQGQPGQAQVPGA